MATKRKRKKKTEPASRGLTPTEVAGGAAGGEVSDLESKIEAAGGQTLARYRDPLGGSWLLLAALPVASVRPTPFQRDLSDAHAKRLAEAIDQVGVFLDPIIAVAAAGGNEERFWTPNGYHRLRACEALGARTITALVSPDPRLAYRILALNTEKAHNVKERCLEAVRMARGLADLDPKAKELGYAIELQEAHFVTLGCAYETKSRFAGGAYAPVLKASDAFLDRSIAAALTLREKRAARLLAIDERVGEIIAELKERGFDSPYLRNFVVARIRPFRPRGKAPPEIDDLLAHMEKAAAKFNLDRVRGEDLAKAAGGSED